MALESGSTTYELAEGKRVTIGRSPDVDILVDHPSISRRHAVVTVGERVHIEDTGSSNGTFVNGRRLAAGRPVELIPGESFDVGSVACLLKGGDDRATLRSLRTHSHFLRRIADEVEATGPGGSFGVIRVSTNEDSSEVVSALLAAVAPGDVVAQYAPCEYELLLVGARPDDVERAARAIGRRLDGPHGHAVYPRDGRAADDLLAAACEALAGGAEVAEVGDGVILEDPAMKALYDLVPRVARGGVNALLLGETGAGKEVLAEALHRSSPRAEAPLVRLNCAAFSETLVEAELFGSEKGAFTGADKRKIGLLETASGGTVFLDEVGELDLGIQAKLLRVLETGRLRRIGGTQEIDVDVVYVAATNRDLQAEIVAGRFRADLFFRLNGFTFTIPPLRDRPSEILPLAQRFARAAARRMGEDHVPVFSDGARRALLAYRWPGNIRELRNAMDRAILLAAGSAIEAGHLPVAESASPGQGPTPVSAPASPAPSTGEVPSGLTEAQLAERQSILDALAQTRGNQTKAAKQLGMSRRWLSTKMARYGIRRARD